MSDTHRAIAPPLPELTGLNDLSLIPSDFSDYLVGIRRHLHRHPEIGLHEVETSSFIRRTLEEHGLEVVGPLAETGFYTDIKGEFDGPTVAYRADIDALPIQDGKDTDYASLTADLAHLCGHDAHSTIAIGTAILVSRLRHLIHGTVRILFQPNEEGIPSGAPLMIRDGVLEGVSSIYASHVDPTLPVGTYGLITGPITASADRFRIAVVAPSTGHSARPHQSIDTIWIATMIMTELYQLIGRISDARNGAVISICRIHGGEAYNVLPSMVEFGGTFRCTEHSDRGLIRDYIVKTATQTASIYDAPVEVDFDYGSPPVINDGVLVETVRNVLIETLGPDSIYDIPVPSMGAEDFAHYLETIPGMLLRVGTASGPETSHPLHDSMFDIDESALMATAQLMSRVLVSRLIGQANGQA